MHPLAPLLREYTFYSDIALRRGVLKFSAWLNVLFSFEVRRLLWESLCKILNETETVSTAISPSEYNRNTVSDNKKDSRCLNESPNKTEREASGFGLGLEFSNMCSYSFCVKAFSKNGATSMIQAFYHESDDQVLHSLWSNADKICDSPNIARRTNLFRMYSGMLYSINRDRQSSY